MHNSTDNFEQIAKEAIIALTSVIMTLRITGDESWQKLADAVSDRTEALIDRAIALGGK